MRDKVGHIVENWKTHSGRQAGRKVRDKLGDKVEDK